MDYFKELADSNEKTAGWKELEDKDWTKCIHLFTCVGDKKAKMNDWLKDTGAVGFWRCANGNGPIDQFRVTFTIECALKDVLSYLDDFPKDNF